MRISYSTRLRSHQVARPSGKQFRKPIYFSGYVEDVRVFCSAADESGADNAVSTDGRCTGGSQEDELLALYRGLAAEKDAAPYDGHAGRTLDAG